MPVVLGVAYRVAEGVVVDTHVLRLSRRLGLPVIVAEIGIRSAAGAAEKPWESAEERAAEPKAQAAR